MLKVRRHAETTQRRKRTAFGGGGGAAAAVGLLQPYGLLPTLGGGRCGGACVAGATAPVKALNSSRTACQPGRSEPPRPPHCQAAAAVGLQQLSCGPGAAAAGKRLWVL